MDDDEIFCEKLRGFTFVEDAFMCELGVVIKFHKGTNQEEVAAVSLLCRMYADVRADLTDCHPTEQ